MNTKERIKTLIEESKNVSTIAELERVLDISNGTINRWSSNNPSIDPLKKVAEYFNVSVDYLLCRTDDPTVPGDADEIVMMFRKNEADLSEEKKAQFRKDVEKYMRFIRSELDE